MTSTEYVYFLSDAEMDRLRVIFDREGKGVLRFVVQCEAKIGEQWHAITRFDTAHGFVHQDVLHANGSTEKLPLPWTSFNLALTHATQDLRARWPWYRRSFEREMRGET